MAQSIPVSDVALLGLGSMGSALARTLVGAGHRVTVWNRSDASRAAFQGLCSVAETPLEACASADLVLTCLSSYAAAYDVLDNDEIKKALAGKTLVQLSTATPDEARAFGAWAAGNGIDYLDAKIGTVPAGIGAPLTVIFYAGPQSLFERHEPVLKSLSGRATFMGEALDRAVIGDFAFLSVYWAGTIGLLHGAAVSAAAGMDIKQFFSLSTSFVNEISERARSFEELVLSKEYTKVQSSLRVDLAGSKLWANTVRALGLNPVFAQAIVDITQDAVDRGDGALDTASMMETFLSTSVTNQK
jgi:3-hydroxyisobutyrate dehydrogenase-like beta-hydroxyacid dehydrogenase